MIFINNPGFGGCPPGDPKKHDFDAKKNGIQLGWGKKYNFSSKGGAN